MSPKDAAAALLVPDSSAPAARKVKFVASDPSRGGLPVKRKQVQHACAACRRKKRRCIHADGAAAADESVVDESNAHESSPSQGSPGTQRSSATPQSRYAHLINESDTYSIKDARAVAPRPKTPPPVIVQNGNVGAQSSRFVGDLNPEGIFMEATASVLARQSSQKGDVGMWLPATAAGGLSQTSQFITSQPPPIMDRFLLPFVREHCLSCLPPEEDFVKLKNIFLTKIDPIFPIIPTAALSGPLDHPRKVVLRQLVCLAAGTDCEMDSNRRLQNQGSQILSPQDFNQTLSSAVRAILETSLITDRVLHIQALTMLSLYTQPTCAEESDLPAQLGGRAIHHIQTLGLHLLRYNAPNCDDLVNLFCAVWALDRINGAVYGRPCLIHERDIGADFDECVKKCPPCFRLLLSVIQWLDKVVELYRPGPSAEVTGFEKVAYIDLPVLEAMVVDAGAINVAPQLVATIEVLYHTVIILSCRLPRPGTTTAAATLPPPSANARRSLAAERIACAVPRDCLSSVPFVPYAVSLALSVEYRKMRHSRLPMFRARAMNAFKRNCGLLRVWSEYFWSANVVAGLGERVLKEMERAANTLARESTPATADADAPAAVNGNAQPATQQSYVSTLEPNMTNLAAGMDNMVDFSLIDAVSGQDVFGHIDPNFNLEAVEDVLEANLDIGLQVNWGDWGQFAT